MHTQPLSAPDFSVEPLPWYRQIASRFAAYWCLKAVGTTLFMTAFFTAYMHLLRNPLFPVTVMPLTGLDDMIAFRPETLYFYLSLWLYVSLPPAFLDTKPELYSFLWHVSGLCLLGMAFFLAWPTAVPRPDLDWRGMPGFALLNGIDAAGNACPSLHVATAVFSGIWLEHLFRRTGSPRAVRLINWAWCVGIVYSTLAIKQHVVLDVAAGGLLGLFFGALSLRLRPVGRSRRL